MDIMSLKVGIDVAKGHLDVSIGGEKSFRILNVTEEIDALAARLSKDSKVFIESSGGYERLVRERLRAAGVEVITLDPLRLRRLAQAHGKQAKTDYLDAKHLAINGDKLQAIAPKSTVREELAEFSRAIESLQAQITELKKQLAMTTVAQVQTHRKNLIAMMKAELAEMEKGFLQAIKQSELKERYNLARSVAGVGPVLARVITCELPDDLSQFTSAQISSYAGLAPMDNSSGRRNSPARISRGNVHIKAALYMPACCVIRTQDWAKDLYKRLRAKGRVHQQAAVAVMRRLLVQIVAVLKRGSAWQAEPPNG